MATVFVPRERLVRWFTNFEGRHGGAAYNTVGSGLRAVAADGSTAAASLPFDRPYDGAPVPEAFAAAVEVPRSWGILLVRKGGFAVARLAGADLVEHKIGQRHVQGRTKAGGQSQQRFARRRDNQARIAYEAAADHAARILTGRLEALVTGGDRAAVDAVLQDARLAAAARRRTALWLSVPDPRRATLDAAIQDACSAVVDVVNAE